MIIMLYSVYNILQRKADKLCKGTEKLSYAQILLMKSSN